MLLQYSVILIKGGREGGKEGGRVGGREGGKEGGRVEREMEIEKERDYGNGLIFYSYYCGYNAVWETSFT